MSMMKQWNKLLHNINDCHIHLGPSGPWVPGFDPSITIAKLVKVIRKFNIKRAVVFPNPLPGSKYPDANSYIISCVHKYPEKLIGFGRIDPRYGLEVLPEIKRLSANGIKGIKLHPVVECFCPDHPFFFPVYETLLNSGIKFILAHSSSKGFGDATRWVKIANKFPQLIIILAHLNETCLPLIKQFPNVYADTSTSSITLIEKACSINHTKLLFGSDYPYTEWEQEAKKIVQAHLPIHVKERILYKNFEEVFYG